MANLQENSIFYRCLGLEDLAGIVALENTVWPDGLRADESIITKRLQCRHAMLGAFRSGKLIGMACWRYGYFDPDNQDTMPTNFNEFANQANGQQINAAFVYNFALLPEIRNSKIGPSLIANGIDILLKHDCKYLVGASRCPSYSESSAMREAITHSQMPLPCEQDPVLNFYRRTLACIFTRPLAGFLPADAASGGYAIGFYKELR